MPKIPIEGNYGEVTKMKGIKRLINALNEEVKCCDLIMEHQKAEQKNILNRNYDGIDENVLNIERLCWHIENLERERENAATDISLEIGRGRFPESVTLSELTEQVREPEKSTLKDLSDKLTNLLDEVQAINKENSFLLGRSLTSVSQVLCTLLQEITETNSAYTLQGSTYYQSCAPALINRTV